MSFASPIPHTFFGGINGSMGHNAKFSATFLTAVPIDLINHCQNEGSTDKVQGLIGMYDHDYHATAPHASNKIPSIDIWALDRDDYVDALRRITPVDALGFQFILRYDLNGQFDSNNELAWPSVVFGWCSPYQ